MADARLFDDTRCLLGEGAFWHPLRQQFFWFDILGRRLLTRTSAGQQHWDFDDLASAAGWIDRDTLMIATERAFLKFDITTGRSERLADLEADLSGTRSNDGRADPAGGFWIGTMGKNAEARACSIWRYYRGEVRRIVPGITITNAICFAPDGLSAYYADTVARQIMRVRLGRHGWPVGDAEVFIDMRGDEGAFPDGAVTDAEGQVWNAQWGLGRVARYDLQGQFAEAFAVPAVQASCPAFGGADFTTLYVTSAATGLKGALADDPAQGCTYAIDGVGRGRAEPQVNL